MGTVLDPSGIVIAANAKPAAKASPRIASMGGERLLAVYNGFHASANTQSHRVLARLVQSP
ncbi:hypothetical protein [Stigmatella aurantiaca]|nr:hypothetical protein [Stigmatella aurantiaca]